MNYRQARQVDPATSRPDAGKWRWTCMNDGVIWADGACADCAGHDTPEEACEHERQRRVGQMAFSPLNPDEHRYKPGRCQVGTCANVATHRAQIPNQTWRVCGEHADAAAANTLVEPFSGETASW
jgi:hypothetical protein